MKKLIVLWVIYVCSASSMAALIAEVHDSFLKDNDTITFQLWYSESYPFPDPIHGTILDWIDIDVTQTGMTYFVDSESDPDFNTFVSMVTNGINDHFRTNMRIEGNDYTKGEYESNYFANPNVNYSWSLSLNEIDLQGYEIEKIGLKVNQGEVFYQFYGVPEPATLSLLAVGGLTLLGKRK